MLVYLARNDLGCVALPGTFGDGPCRAVERSRRMMHVVTGVGGVPAVEHDAFDLPAATFPAEEGP